MRRRTPKIQDIAQIAGVSTATVSRALSNPDIVAEATHRAVMEAVAQTGYRINHMARNLRRQRSGSILALVPNLANPFFSQILAGLSAVLSPAGYGLLIADTHTDPNPAERLAYYLHSGLADGVVIFDGTLPKSALQTRSGVPIVMACEWTDTPLPSVRVANAEGAAIAIRHLAAMGHRKIGYQTGPRGNVLTLSRFEGMQSAMSALGLQLRDDWIFDGDFGLACGASAARRWLALADRPTAVFCASDEMACGFMGEVQHAGISVPDEVSVVGFDNIEVSRHLAPALTTIHQPRGLIGERAARILIGMIDTGVLTAESEVIPVELIRRNSVADLRMA